MYLIVGRQPVMFAVGQQLHPQWRRRRQPSVSTLSNRMCNRIDDLMYGTIYGTTVAGTYSLEIPRNAGRDNSSGTWKIRLGNPGKKQTKKKPPHSVSFIQRLLYIKLKFCFYSNHHIVFFKQSGYHSNKLSTENSNQLVYFGYKMESYLLYIKLQRV